MMHNRPFTKLLIPFFQCYNVLPPEIMRHSIPYIAYRGGFILRKHVDIRNNGFQEIDRFDLENTYRSYQNMDQMRVSYRIMSQENGDLFLGYSVFNYSKIFNITFSAKPIPEAEDELLYAEVMKQCTAGIAPQTSGAFQW